MEIKESLDKVKDHYKYSPYHSCALNNLQFAWEYGRQKINVNDFLSNRLGQWHKYSAANYEQLKEILPIYPEEDLNYLTAIQPHAKEYIYLNDLLLYVMDKDTFSEEKIEGSPWNGKLFNFFDRLSSIFTPGQIEAFPQFFEWGYPGGEFKGLHVDYHSLIFQYVDDDSFSIGKYIVDVNTIRKSHMDWKYNYGYFTVLEVPKQLFELKDYGWVHNQPYDYTAAPGKRYIVLCLQRLQRVGVAVGTAEKLWD